MKKNKIKYFGLCATALVTIAPIVSSVGITASQALTTSVVKAADDQAYTDLLKAKFNSSVNFSKSQLKDLSTSSFDGKLSINTAEYQTTDLFKSVTDTNAVVYDNLKIEVPFFRSLVKSDVKMEGLASSDYKLSLKITSTKFSGEPTSSTDLIDKLKALNVGDQFTITMTMKHVSNTSKVASYPITATVTADPTSKIKIPDLGTLSVAKDSNKADAEDVSKNIKAIKDVKDTAIFHSFDFGSSYYYGINGSTQYKTISGTTFALGDWGNGTGAIITQLIPIHYNYETASKYDPSSFVFIDDTSHKVLDKAPDPSATQIAYIPRRIIIGSPTYPEFRYTSTVSGAPARNTYGKDSTLPLNTVDAEKLTYIFNDSRSWVNLDSYLQEILTTDRNGAGNLVAFVKFNDDKDTDNRVKITYTLPHLKATTSPQNAIATAIDPKTGAESKLKIPVKVTDIPNVNSTPSISKFPENDSVTINSKTTSKYDIYKDVAATYLGADNATHNLPKAFIKATVKDSKGSTVSLNYDGTMPTTTVGTYKIQYVFSNPGDSTKKVTRDLTVNVTATDLVAPTVSGFYDNGTYTLSNDKQKEVSPFAPVLRMDRVTASYIGSDSASHYVDSKKVVVTVKNQLGSSVSLNSNGMISMATPGTYTVTYTWANPEDTSKTVSKSLTLIVNQIASQAITPNLSNKEVVNPTIDTNTTSFNVLNNINFTYNYTDPASSTPSTQRTGTIPNNLISISVTKDGKDVPLSNYSFQPTIGTYKIVYTAVNPQDNAITLSYTRTLTVQAPNANPTPTPNPSPTPNPTAPTVQFTSGVLYINYVWGYGVNLWKNYNTTGGMELNSDGSIRKLMTGSAWKYRAVATYPDGSTWYRLGTNQWVQGQYASFVPMVNPNSWNITSSKGVGVIHYVPGYSVNLWTSPNQTNWTKKLRHGTSWKYFKVATKNGKSMYNLGGNQWVDGSYFFPKK
ncbi:hypothetical protein [Xylocopilactobacillus apis]|uniref:Uncharacterized protein n=1 Tax=Xylocopilactobacillus apis TaxID=2932183 RepID=A0AAU9DB73_9LACO|nr:hypothetical protein [Xylocopilactobacillus apis]BDR57000.1 hypothetical protein KIMC2_15620 [Xylocopilactobacillus apis]